MHPISLLHACFILSALLLSSCSQIGGSLKHSHFEGNWALSEVVLYENGKQVLAIDKQKEENLIYVYQYDSGSWNDMRYAYGFEVAPFIAFSYYFNENGTATIKSEGHGQNDNVYYRTDAPSYHEVYGTMMWKTFYEENDSFTLCINDYSYPSWRHSDDYDIFHAREQPIDATFTHNDGVVYTETIIKQVYAVRLANRTTSSEALYDAGSDYKKLILPKDSKLHDGKTHTYNVRFIYKRSR